MINLSVVVVGDISTNCYVLFCDSGKSVVIDPGDKPEKIIKFLTSKNLTPEYILLTHGHHDHIGGIKAIQKEYPNVKVGIGEKDTDMICNPKNNYAYFRGKDLAAFEGLKEDFTVKEGDKITCDEMEITVVETPGHTKGGVTYICGDSMFTGDSLFAGDIGRTDLYGGSYETLLQSVTKIMLIPGEYTVYPGHGSSTTMSHERKHNNYVRV